MSEHEETIAEILADIPKKYPSEPSLQATVTMQFLHDEMMWISERFAAAWRREREKLQLEYDDCARDYNRAQRERSHLRRELVELKKAPGNAAAMREALMRADKFISVVGAWLKDHDEVGDYALAAGVTKTLVEHALSAPARNCDKYTGEDINRDVADAYVSADSAMMLDYDCEELPIRWLLSTPEQVEEYLKHQDEENHKMWRSIANRRNHKQEASV